MKGREEELREKSHRHPSNWWEMRYTWVNEDGEATKLEWESCGANIIMPEYMVDEFPEQQPHEMVNLKCMKKEVPHALH